MTWSPGDAFLARYESADGVIRGALPLRIVGRRWRMRFASACSPSSTRDEIRAEGERVVAMIERWDPPFSDRWETWRPDPAWSLPELPADWAA